MPATNWQEKSDPGEAQRFEGYAEQLRELQRRGAHGGPPDRALHAKAQAGVLGEFTVLPDLPAHARVGLFATPQTYRALVRYSNGSGARQDDRKPDVRGIAVKLVGVAGEKGVPGVGEAKTQDFLLIPSPPPPLNKADQVVPFLPVAGPPP